MSPKHRASFLEKPEFHELALIPKQFGLEAISKFQHKEEILKEAKRLRNASARKTKRPQALTRRSETVDRAPRRSAGMNLEDDRRWSEPQGIIPEDEPLYIDGINVRDYLDDEEELDHWNQGWVSSWGPDDE